MATNENHEHTKKGNYVAFSGNAKTGYEARHYLLHMGEI